MVRHAPSRAARSASTAPTGSSAYSCSAAQAFISTPSTSGQELPTKPLGEPFFTAVVDTTAVRFAYVERRTSEAVKEIAGEFRGLLQADASSVYEILARGRPARHRRSVALVGCWTHCRHYFFEAALYVEPARRLVGRTRSPPPDCVGAAKSGSMKRFDLLGAAPVPHERRALFRAAVRRSWRAEREKARASIAMRTN